MTKYEKYDTIGIEKGVIKMKRKSRREELEMVFSKMLSSLSRDEAKKVVMKAIEEIVKKGGAR
ncbi:MAG: hypothetical protein DRH51_08470 [Candidatus Coatesbacteria bacterium]|nr:MAG: hypothetical protein DRH51_08470 [Candidatus Coatesbacteria bacterium]